jgi:hypothetical protein
MSQVKANSFTDASGGSAAVLYGVASPPNSMGFRNRIINGSMVIDQRNAGASVTPANGAYTLDRWIYGSTQASKFTVQQTTTAPAGFNYSLKMTVASAVTIGAGDIFGIDQRIEGFNIADLGWGTADAKTVTISFWVQSSLTGTFGGSVLNGTFNRSYPFTFTISAANTWEQKTITVTGDTSGTWNTTNNTGIRLLFSMGSGSTYSGTAGAWSGSGLTSATGATSVVGTNGATFYITGVQLEAGTVASPFERRDYGRELMMCQRYYYVSGPSNSEGAQFVGAPISGALSISIGQGRFPVSMRAAPTVALPSGAGQSGLVADSVCTASQIGTDAFVRVTIGAGAWSNSYTPVQGRFTASAEL